MPGQPTPYDTVPYASLTFPQTHPDRLATVARLFGLSPADVAACRVLELGCASGGNLVPMAFNLPGSEFVGIDLSSRQVEEGRATVKALALSNIRLEHRSILDLDAGWGTFDYVICHGVFSWVERGVQDRIFQIARDHLAPDGVAYVSYNTYPGWHLRESVRHMMRYHAAQFDEPEEQIEQARALLQFLASASDPAGAYGQLLNSEVERLSRASDSYLFHEHLEQTNTPLYFHQFVERAEAAGLFFLSEADVSDMLASHFPKPVADTLERVSPDILHLEQYMDFVRNRFFRQTLLCHAEVRPRRALTPAFLHGLLASSPAVTSPLPVDLTPGKAVVFRRGEQRADASLPATKAAFGLLMEAWPEAVDVDELCTASLERAARCLGNTPPGAVRGGLLGDLFQGVLHGIVQLHTQPLPCTRAPADPPRAHPLSAYQAGRGNVVANAHHDSLQLDPFALQVLKLANGQRRRSEILQALEDLHASGALVVEGRGGRVTAPEAARAILAERLEEAIAFLARSAVLVG